MTDLEEIVARRAHEAELGRQMQNAAPQTQAGIQQASPEQLGRWYAMQAEQLRAMFRRPHWYGRTAPDDVQ